MSDLTELINKWEEKLKDAYEEMEYFKKKTSEKWVEIGVVQEAIKRLKGDDYK